MLQVIRKKLFWTLDSLKGGSLKKHYDDIHIIMENLNSTESKSRRMDSLENLLRHAVTTTPFYKDYSHYTTLDDFTVIDKNIIRDHYENFMSSVYKNQKNHSAYTSGSTGTPFRVLHNKKKQKRHSADVIYFGQKAGFQIGHKLYYIRHWDQYNSSKPWVQKIKNIYTHPVSKLANADVDQLLLNMSKNVSSKGIMCYASVLNEIRKYLVNTNQPPKVKNVKSIIAISESLKEDAREAAEKYFGVPVISRYSNVENGILAQQSISSKKFHINWASYYVEILDLNSDLPAKPGDLGRIVITDLYNHCMPIIRYDTGDIGQIAMNEDSQDNVIILDKIEGRKMDMITNTKGDIMSPFTVYHIMKYPHIVQYQFIQESQDEYKIKLNVTAKFKNGDDIVSEFKNHLGTDAKIDVEFVEDIPLLSSGKRKFVLNNFKLNPSKKLVK